MTKTEYDYTRMIQQMDDLQKKIAQKKVLLDKERDEMIIEAIHEIDITREQGLMLARILKNGENLETILNLTPKDETPIRKRRARRKKNMKESEEIQNEE